MNATFAGGCLIARDWTVDTGILKPTAGNYLGENLGRKQTQCGYAETNGQGSGLERTEWKRVNAATSLSLRYECHLRPSAGLPSFALLGDKFKSWQKSANSLARTAEPPILCKCITKDIFLQLRNIGLGQLKGY